MVQFWLKFKSQSQGMVSLLLVVVVGGGGGVAQVSAYCSELPRGEFFFHGRT